METTDFSFDLPKDRIASRPTEVRDRSRLMTVRRDGEIAHSFFFELPSHLRPGDLLIMNNSKVFPARIRGRKRSGRDLELLLVRELTPGTWEVLSKGRYTGRLELPGGLSAEVHDGSTASFDRPSDLMEVLWRMGEMPLPPYIGRQADEHDKERYQTVYASVQGSIAAPTAGLHFTEQLMKRLREAGIQLGSLTLHVGTGTFKPVKTAKVEDHVMDREFFELPSELLRRIETTKRQGGRIIAVGTTTTRTLEGYFSGRCSVSSSNGVIRGVTDIFIREGFTPSVVDGLITNFHLPCSTPLMLTAVFAGRERLLSAYRSAVDMGYRFFSYGDAMLVL